MLNIIKQCFPNPNEDKLNLDIMEHRTEKPLEEYIVNCFKSITSSLTEITMTSYKFVDDVQSVNMTDYERTRSNRQADKDQKYTYISDSRVGELTMYFKVDLSDNPLANGHDQTLYYTVRLLIPIEDEFGRIYLKGNNYPIQYQLTERTTYVTPGALVCKALMGIKLYKHKIECRDYKGDLYTMNSWRSNMFSGTANTLYFFFESYGWYDTLEFFDIGEVVDLYDGEERDDDKYVYLDIKPPLYLRVRKAALQSAYIQGMVGTIVTATQKMTKEEILDKKTWVAKIGSTKRNAPKESWGELGGRYRILFNRMLDESSIEAYQLTDYNKKDILHIIRWMIQENDPLRAKDNMNILNKRLRRHERTASMMNGVISERIKKFVNTSVKTWDRLVKKYNDFFAYRGSEVITQIHKSGLAKYDDCVNDMDVFKRFKITMKGPNAIGNKNSRNISAKQRDLDASHIGIISLDFCSASEPGLTNYVNPLTETNGLYFKDSPPEPETFAYDRWRESLSVEEHPNGDGTATVAIEFTDPVLFNNILDVVDNIHIRQKPRNHE